MKFFCLLICVYFQEGTKELSSVQLNFAQKSILLQDGGSTWFGRIIF